MSLWKIITEEGVFLFYPQETKQNTTVLSVKEPDSVCQKRKNICEGKEDKKSWIDPPEEPKTVTLTQAEIESCMQTYEVELHKPRVEYILTQTHRKFGNNQQLLPFDRTHFRTIRRCSSSLATWCSSPLRFLWRPCVPLSTTSSRFAVMPWSSVPAFRDPSGRGSRTSDSGRWVKNRLVRLWWTEGTPYTVAACEDLLFSHLELQTAMEAMGLIAIIVNCYLIGQCGQLQRLFPWLSPEMTIVSIVLLEVCVGSVCCFCVWTWCVCELNHPWEVQTYIGGQKNDNKPCGFHCFLAVEK